MEPITLTRGGTITENISNPDANKPAITINTTEPVIIDSCVIESAGPCIFSNVQGANIVVRNTKAKGLVPLIDGKMMGRFIHAQYFASILIENNEIEQTAGIYLYAGKNVRVEKNKARNIDGRNRSGAKAERVQFVQLNKIHKIPGIVIAWNEIINEYGKSAVEDVISIHNSSGTSDSPIQVRDNYIDGAYALPSETTYSGGGIMIDRYFNATTGEVTAWVRVYDNQVIRTQNYGIAIAGGNNNELYNNKVLSTNITLDGKKLGGQGAVGQYIWNMNNAPDTLFFNNVMHHNTIGYMKHENGTSVLNNSRTINGVSRDNIFLPAVTKELEDAEYVIWQAKLKANNIQIGVQAKGISLSELIKIAGVEAGSAEELITKVRAQERSKALAEGEQIGITKGEAIGYTKGAAETKKVLISRLGLD